MEGIRLDSRPRPSSIACLKKNGGLKALNVEDKYMQQEWFYLSITYVRSHIKEYCLDPFCNRLLVSPDLIILMIDKLLGCNFQMIAPPPRRIPVPPCPPRPPPPKTDPIPEEKEKEKQRRKKKKRIQICAIL